MNKIIATLMATIALLPAVARAAEVKSFLVTKGQQLVQTNENIPALDAATNYPHRFFSSVDGSTSNSILGVSLKLPNATTKVFTNDGGYMLSQEFTNKTLLDASYGVGTYAFTIQTLLDGTNKPSLKLPADAYPPVPQIANWPHVQAVEASLPFTLFWFPWAGGTTNDFIQLDIEGTNGNFVAGSPNLLNPAHLNGTNGSAIISAATFAEDTTYNARLIFVKRTTVDTTNISGATGSAGYYRETKFPITTLPAAPAGGRVQFSTIGFLVPEDIGDSHEVTITRTGSEEPFDVQLNIFDGTATNGLDYIKPTSSIVHFAQGEHTVAVSIPVVDDYLLDGNKYAGLVLAPPSLGTLGPRSNALFTILDNEVAAAGKIQFAAPAFAFAESTRLAQVKLTRIGGSTGAVSATFHTMAGTAIGDVDFIPTNGVVNFADGQTTNTILVPLIGDALDETNEYFWVILESTTGGAALGTNASATITITDDDTAGVIAFKSATYTTNENSGSALITVVRTKGVAEATVDFATADGTAFAPLDYFPAGGTLTFGSNELTKTFSVALNNDFAVETNETVLLRLSHPTGGATLGALSNATLRIIDEDSKFSFTNANYVVGEAGKSVSINIFRTGSLVTTSAVSFATAGITATSTNDYRGTNGTLVFPTNTKFKTLVIPVFNDTIVESNEAFTVTLSNPLNGAQLGDIPVTTVTITNEDRGGVIFFSTNSYSANESGTNAIITLTRTNGIASAVSVDFTTSNGTAAAGIDYSNANQTVTFAAGETSKKVLVPIINDTIDETNKTVLLALSNPQGGGALGANTNATLTIVDNDSGGVIAFKSATFTTNENSGAFTVIVVRTNGIASDVSVDFTTENGSALAGDDYTATNGTLFFAAGETNKFLSIVITDDVLPEGNETFAMHLSNPTGGATLGAISNATLTIRDDESSVAFSAANYVVGEGGTNVTITIIRSGALITPVTVQFSTENGSALTPDDYRGTNATITFPTNVSSQTIKVPIVNDTIVEAAETFGVVLHTPTGGLQLGTQTNATVTITNNDFGGLIFFATNSYAVNENGTNAIITLSRTNGLASGVSVLFITENGSAEAGTDYSNATQTVIFAAGETSKKVLVPIINDTLDEANETVHLALSDAQGGASLGARIEAELTIVDNDTGGVIAFKSANFSTNENSGSALITVTRTGGVASGVTVEYRTRNGTADDSSDYDEAHDTLAFGAGETNKTFSVTIHDETVAEGNETVLLELSNPTGGATLGAISNATLTIVDDESSFAFSNATYTVSEAGPFATLSVLRSGGLVTPATVQFATTNNGSAVAFSDYLPTNGTLSFPVGVGSQTIKVPILNDTLVEDDETFGVRLFNPTGGAVLGSLTNTTVTITNNDFGGVLKFSAANYTGIEGSNPVVTITRTGGVASGVTVDFTIGGGSATKGADYADVSGVITFGAGETTKKVIVPVYLDILTESNEVANLTLSNPTGGATLGSPVAAALNLINVPNTNGIPLAGTPYFNLTMTGTNNFTFQSSIAITNIGTQHSGNSADSRTNYYTNIPVFTTNVVGGVTNLVGKSNTVLTARSERWVFNNREGNYRVITDQIQLKNFQVPGPGVRTLEQGLPGTLIETFTDLNGSVLLSNYLLEWESGTITVDEADYAPDGTVRGFSGRINVIAKSPVSTNRVLLIGSFRFHP